MLDRGSSGYSGTGGGVMGASAVVTSVVVVVGSISAVVRVSSSQAGAGVLGSGFAEVVDLPLERRLLAMVGAGVGFTCCFVTAAGSSVAVARAGGSVSPSPVVSGPGGASVLGVSVLQKRNVKKACDSRYIFTCRQTFYVAHNNCIDGIFSGPSTNSCNHEMNFGIYVTVVISIFPASGPQNKSSFYSNNFPDSLEPVATTCAMRWCHVRTQ